MDNEELKQEINKAIENVALQGALTKFTSAYPGNRAKVYVGYDFEALRDKVHEVKTYAADHIDEILDEFSRNATARELRYLLPKTLNKQTIIFVKLLNSIT